MKTWEVTDKVPFDKPDKCVIETDGNEYRIVNWWDYGTCDICEVIRYADYLTETDDGYIVCVSHEEFISDEDIDKENAELNEAWLTMVEAEG